MNQSTSNTKPALEGATNGEASGKAAGQPRRYRRPSRAKSPATPQAATPISPVPPAEPADTSPSTPAKATSARTPAAPKLDRTRGSARAKPEAAATPPAAKVAEPAEARPRTRSQRNPRRNKGDVQLVVPPTSNGNGNGHGPDAVAPLPVPPEAFALPAPVPVLTVEPSTAAAEAVVAPEHEDEGSAESATPTSKRYRFNRPAAAAVTAPQQTVRPERLSGLLSNPPAAATPVSSSPTEAPEAETDTEAESEPFDLFGPRPAGAYSRGSTADDILSELGLRGESRNQATAPEEEAEPFVEEPAEDRSNHSGPIPSVAAGEPHDTEAEEEAPEAGSSEGDTGATTRRRRRRRRSSPAHTTPSEEMPDDQDIAEPSWSSNTAPAVSAPPQPQDISRAATAPYTGPAAAPAPTGRRGSADQYATNRPAAAESPSWDISSAQQYITRDDSPFEAPAPSFARGFGPQPRGISSSTSTQNLYSPRPTRTERGTDTPPMSSNQLANIVSSAIAQQTDRLLTELRYQQHPPSMTVMFPPTPSTERVGIFVDVANLIYSSRSLRINLDFGRLLEFLRGNRRLIRAHAYAPTNPDPGADQTFLSAVKGMGYRITTKNYKTFSSGAKKADMDLDLCMDIVRMVDAGALDTVVLVSGDSDFLPLLEYCSDHGVRVEAAAFDDSAAMILRQSCDLFINLTLATDIRS